MTDGQILKLRTFINDGVMSDAVFNILNNSFLKFKGQRDVNLMAAERLALDLLLDGWKELEKYKSSDKESKVISSNIGL